MKYYKLVIFNEKSVLVSIHSFIIFDTVLSI